MKNYSKIIITIIAVVLLVTAYNGVVDDIGMENTEQGFKRAIIVYGIARGLNGVISVAQGTELAFQPVGVGITITPGEILDPINDLVEQFSWVILVSGTSLGLQRVLLEITSLSWFTLIVTFLTILALLLLWWNKQPIFINKVIFYRLALVLIILRFCVPVAAFCSESVYNLFLNSEYTNTLRQLENTSAELNKLNKEVKAQQPAENEEKSLMDNMRNYLSDSFNLNIQKTIDKYKTVAENIVEFIMNLIVVFIFQTILIPLIFVWLIIKLLQWVIMHSFQ